MYKSSDIDYIRELLLSGKTCEEVAKLTGRPVSAIRKVSKRNGWGDPGEEESSELEQIASTMNDSMPEPEPEAEQKDEPEEEPEPLLELEDKERKETPSEEPEKTKRCAHCGKILPLSAFGKNKNAKSGLQWACKKCCAEMTRERYYREHPNAVPKGTRPKEKTLADFTLQEIFNYLDTQDVYFDTDTSKFYVLKTVVVKEKEYIDFNNIS